MHTDNIIVLPSNYFSAVHPDTAKDLAQKTKCIRFSLPLFSSLVSLVDVVATGLGKAHKEAKTTDEKHAVLDKFLAVDRAVSSADAIGEIRQEPHTRLVLLTEGELDALRWLLELARTELDCRMAPRELRSDDAADEIQALYHAGLDEVVATVQLNTRRIESNSDQAA